MLSTSRVALTTNVSRMYRVVLLPEHQRDLHRFVWREKPQQPLKDYRITRLTFGVSASPFAAIMAMRQNAMDHRRKYSLAVQAVMNDFYVDDGLDGANSIDEAIKLRNEMQELLNVEDLCSGSGSRVNQRSSHRYLTSW